MAAYAALVSVMHVIDNLQNHCRPPITLHKEQAHVLTQKVTFLQQFLQVYNSNLPYSKEADPLESRIARAAYAAEDAIESHILDRYTSNDGENMISDGLYKALEKVTEDMALIEKEAMEINKETAGRLRNQLLAKSTTPADPSASSSAEQKKSTMVGADDLLFELKDKLTSGIRDLQTIPIVGMGGSGKTTLALNIYEDGSIIEYFDICAWVTISQEYSIGEILSQLVNEPNSDLSEGKLGEMLHKHLYGKRYLIILDDIWSLKAWDGVKRFFPNNKKGSRIVITTRLTELASALHNSNSLQMKLLDDDDSWNLISKIVFGEKDCPPAFEKIGKKIGRSCKGLPLSIVVVGGLLAMSEQLIECWEYIEDNLNEIVNLEDDERCLKILYMSYRELPIHLKPCFLYMGIYREDHVIRIRDLIKLWVAEGFLKPISGKRLEDVARAYIEDLTNRNLILIHKVGSYGSIKECKVHDLLRDLCLREAQKHGFYTVDPRDEIEDRVSRIVMSSTIPGIEEVDALSSVPLARSMILDLSFDVQDVSPQQLRILGSRCELLEDVLDNMPQLVNSRFFTFTVTHTELPSLVWLFWNLQTLFVGQFDYEGFTAPIDFWYMSNIRHLYFDNLDLPEPPNVQDDVVLANLQTLGCIKDFVCSEQVIKRIPNIKKLEIIYEEGNDDRFCLTNLDCLDKLESFNCTFNQSMFQINYPRSLKKLSLGVDKSQCWQDTVDAVGTLPLLQKLVLRGGTFEGEWETTDGQFQNLKFLSLKSCEGLEVWTSEASHFPRLEQLHLDGVDDLEEIPLDFADISTLTLIHLEFVSTEVIESANRILEEQESTYGEDEATLQIQVELWCNNDPDLKSLGRPNFQVT